MSFRNLSGELLLEILSNIDFCSSDIRALRGVNRQLRGLITDYECSLAKQTAAKQLPNAFVDFPSGKDVVSVLADRVNFRWLKEISERYQKIDKVLEVLRKAGSCVPGHTYHRYFFFAGYVLMQRVADLGTVSYCTM